MKKENRRILASAMITSFMTTFMSSALNLSIPSIESYFDVNATLVSWIISAYTISIAALSLPMGKIADITSRRRIFLAGIMGFGILSLISIFSPDIWALISARALMGLCGAMIFATNNSILISAFPHSVQGKMLGYSVAATYIGLTAGPVAGGLLNSAYGWRSIFAASAVVSLAAFLAAFRAVPHDTQSDNAANSAFDTAGVLLYVSAILTSLYGLTVLGSSRYAPALLVAGLILLIAFFMHESGREHRSMSAVIRVSIFRCSRTFTFSSLAALLTCSRPKKIMRRKGDSHTIFTSSKCLGTTPGHLLCTDYAIIK